MRNRLKLLSIPLLITVGCWGFNFVGLKLLYREVSPEAVSLARFCVMWVLLALWCWLRGESLRPEKRDLLRLWALGLVTMGIYMVLFLTGLHNTGAGEGAIVLATVPLITPLLAALLKQEVLSWAALGGALLAFAGVACVAFGATGASTVGRDLWRGDVLVLASAFCWAFGIVLTKPLLSRYSPVQVLTMSMPGALPALIPFGLMATIHTSWIHLSFTAWMMFLQVAILSGVVAFVGFNTGILQVGASGATLYQFLVTPLAAFFAYIILGQTLTWIQWIGFAVVITGVWAGSVARQKGLENRC